MFAFVWVSLLRLCTSSSSTASPSFLYSDYQVPQLVLCHQTNELLRQLLPMKLCNLLAMHQQTLFEEIVLCTSQPFGILKHKVRHFWLLWLLQNKIFQYRHWKKLWRNIIRLLQRLVSTPLFWQWNPNTTISCKLLLSLR